MRVQLERRTAGQTRRGFSLVRKLLAFNDAGRNAWRSSSLSPQRPGLGHAGVPFNPALRTADQARQLHARASRPGATSKPLNASLFLSAHLGDVRAALDAGVPAAQVYRTRCTSDAHPHEVRIAFDGDAVLFSDEAERVFKSEDLQAFQRHEKTRPASPCPKARSNPARSTAGLQRAGTPACASAPRWSPRSSARPMSARHPHHS